MSGSKRDGSGGGNIMQKALASRKKRDTENTEDDDLRIDHGSKVGDSISLVSGGQQQPQKMSSQHDHENQSISQQHDELS